MSWLLEAAELGDVIFPLYKSSCGTSDLRSRWRTRRRHGVWKRGADRGGFHKAGESACVNAAPFFSRLFSCAEILGGGAPGEDVTPTATRRFSHGGEPGAAPADVPFFKRRSSHSGGSAFGAAGEERRVVFECRFSQSGRPGAETACEKRRSKTSYLSSPAAVKNSRSTPPPSSSRRVE
jgi:hypothetical protein